MEINTELTPEQMLAHAEALKKAAIAKAAELKQAEIDKAAKAARDAAEQARQDRIKRTQTFRARLVNTIKDRLAERGIVIFIDPENPPIVRWSTDPVKNPDFPKMDDNRVDINIDVLYESDGRWSRRPTDRHVIIIGDYGNKSRYVEKKDGKFNETGVIDAVYCSILRDVNRRKSELAHRSASQVVAAIKEAHPFYAVRFETTDRPAKGSQVRYRYAGMYVDFSGDVDTAKKLIDLGDELVKILNADKEKSK